MPGRESKIATSVALTWPLKVQGTMKLVNTVGVIPPCIVAELRGGHASGAMYGVPRLKGTLQS